MFFARGWACVDVLVCENFMLVIKLNILFLLISTKWQGFKFLFFLKRKIIFFFHNVGLLIVVSIIARVELEHVCFLSFNFMNIYLIFYTFDFIYMYLMNLKIMLEKNFSTLVGWLNLKLHFTNTLIIHFFISMSTINI